MLVARATIEDRFWAKVVVAGDGCWLWTGARNENGYGLFWQHGGHVRAHRFSFELHGGVIPTGLDLDHLCRVRHCVNPFHLEPVTRAENVRRSPSSNWTRTHCVKGHALTPDNLLLSNGGKHIRCRTCNAEYFRAYRAANKRAAKPSTEDGGELVKGTVI